jgi:hypothetical protein
MGTLGEEATKVYKDPSVDEVLITVAWFIKVGEVSEKTIHKAVVAARKEGKRNNLTWRAALHRVVNRAARKNEKGWENYRGDWVKLQNTWGAYNL